MSCLYAVLIFELGCLVIGMIVLHALKIPFVSIIKRRLGFKPRSIPEFDESSRGFDDEEWANIDKNLSDSDSDSDDETKI